MGITSRKAASLFSSETLSMAAHRLAKSGERSGRPGNGKARAKLAMPTSPPAACERQPPRRVRQAEPADSGRITLPCLPVKGDPAKVTWADFRSTYAKLAEKEFAKYTMTDWYSAERFLRKHFSPRFLCDVTAEMLDLYEESVAMRGYSKYRMENMVSRLHHMILWGCECGYLDREAFGIGPDLRWPVRDKGHWAKRLTEAAG